MQFFKEKVSKSEAYIWDFHQKMASCFQNLWCQDASLYSCHWAFASIFENASIYGFDSKKCVDLRRFFSFVGLYQSWQGLFDDADLVG